MDIWVTVRKPTTASVQSFSALTGIASTRAMQMAEKTAVFTGFSAPIPPSRASLSLHHAAKNHEIFLQ